MGTYGKLATAGSIAAVLFAAVGPASAACTRLSFSVNDYGKDGPTKDAKDLLDKYIVTKMTERGIAKYTVGNKTVNCELFLDFIVFDEHTCTAEANVCWGDQAAPKKPTPAVAPANTTSKQSTSSAQAPAEETKAQTEKAAATPIVPPASTATDEHARLEATAKQAAEAAKAAKEAAANAQAAADAAEAAAVAASEKVKDKGSETTTGSTAAATKDEGPPVQLAPTTTEEQPQESSQPAAAQATP